MQASNLCGGLSSVGALLKALGAVVGDTVLLQYKSDGRLMIWRAAQQPQQQHQLLAAGTVAPAACPADSIFVGFKNGTRVTARIGAVRALWPEVACQLVCGRSTEVEVHPAVEGAGAEALGPLRVSLRSYQSEGRTPEWQLNGFGPLFRALGAQNRDTIFMWRSPEGGRLMAGVQPRGGGVPVGKEAEQQRQAQGQEVEQQEEQGQAQRMLQIAGPAGSIFVGRKHYSQMDPRTAAVQALWPDLASQWVCGESAEVEVHVAVAGTGGEALGPFPRHACTLLVADKVDCVASERLRAPVPGPGGAGRRRNLHVALTWGRAINGVGAVAGQGTRKLQRCAGGAAEC